MQKQRMRIRNKFDKVQGFGLLSLIGLLNIGLLRAEEKESEIEEILPDQVEKFIIKTRSEMNREIPFYLRVPKNYQKGKAHRLLYLCPCYNGSALELIANDNNKFFTIADERGWFVLSATFQQNGSQVRDRKLSYYYPESFSGKAVLKALELVKGKYDVDTERLLLQGRSGGAQFVHRFALWAPERVTAVAINSSSWFDPAKEGSDQVAWLITIGESDPSFPASTEMVEQLKEMGATPMFRSYIGLEHWGEIKDGLLNLEFIKFYDEWDRHELGKKRDPNRKALQAKDMPYVGDSTLGVYWPTQKERVEKIAPDQRIFLPSEAVAQTWGKLSTD